MRNIIFYICLVIFNGLLGALVAGITFRENKGIITIYTNENIYFVRGDSLISETGSVRYKNKDRQKLLDSLENLSVNDCIIK